MRSSGPSFLPTLIALAAGFYIGRSVFPHLNANEMKEAEGARLGSAFEARKSQNYPLLKGAKALVGQLSTQGPAGWPALRKNILALPSTSEKATQWSVLTHFAAEQKLPGVDVAQEERLSPWFALEVQDPSKKPTSASVRKAQDQTLHTLRANFAKETDPKALAEAAASLGVTQGKVGPVEGQEWLATLGGTNKLAALMGFAEGWSSVEPQEAIGWAVTLVDGLERDVVARGLARGAAVSDPLAVLPWALEIIEKGQRAQAVDGLLKGAAKQNGDMAKDLLEGSNLSAKEKTDFLETLASHIHGISLQQ